MTPRQDLVGAYFGQTETRWQRWVRGVVVGFTLRGERMDPDTEFPLTWSDSPYVPGLREFHGVEDENEHKPISGAAPMVFGTTRMGFGHHRIAYSAYTWALSLGATPYLHDILGIESSGAEVIRRIDAKYSRMSRISSNLGGVVEWLWGRLMQQGGIGSLRMSNDLAQALTPLMRSLPRDIPVICAHPLNGQIAIACGFERVINLVIDNNPQYFTLVPNALNLVQSPCNEVRLLQMGVPQRDLAVGGHWVSHALASNAKSDSAARIARANAKQPRRLLISVGGAGAQERFLVRFVKGLAPRLRDSKLRIFVNVGDHAHMQKAMERCCDEQQLVPRWVTNHHDVLAFCRENALDQSEPKTASAVTLFCFQSHFEAFSATDLLQRVADVLVTKPSELAFFPIPKLHIRRVGNHEAASAQRSAELGDGTPECRTLDEVLRMVELLCDHEDLFVHMNESIARNASIGVYDGGRIAIQHALQPVKRNTTPSHPQFALGSRGCGRFNRLKQIWS